MNERDNRGPSRERGHRPRVEASFEVGTMLQGKVKRIVDFGAFVGLPGGSDGLLHISQIAKTRVNNVRDYLEEGQEVEVKVIKCEDGKVGLSMVF